MVTTCQLRGEGVSVLQVVYHSIIDFMLVALEHWTCSFCMRSFDASFNYEMKWNNCLFCTTTFFTMMGIMHVQILMRTCIRIRKCYPFRIMVDLTEDLWRIMNRRGREAHDHQISPIYQAAVGFCGFCSILKKNRRNRGSPSSFIIGFLQWLDGENDLLVETFSWGLDIFATSLPWNTIFAGCNCGEPNTGIRHCKKKKNQVLVWPQTIANGQH